MKELKTVRKLVTDAQNNILNNIETLSPDELSRIGLELAVLMGNVGDYVAEMESACVRKKRDWLMADKSISNAKAETLMKATDEYLEYRKSQALLISLLETIRMIKKRMKVSEDQYQISGNM